jgi:hypothetical protein
MAARMNQWGAVALAMAGTLAATGAAQAQFNPYVMPRFNPLTATAPGVTTTTGIPSYGLPYDPNSSAYNPYTYGIGPIGGAAVGLAEVYRAYGTVLLNQEQARSMREQAMQAKLETQRKRFELEMYIRANTPTYVEEQIRIARNTLRRIHGFSTPAEIASAKALNVVLDDAGKFPDRKLAANPAMLSEDVLGQLNVTASHFSLGALRNDGKIRWPMAMQDSVPRDQQQALEAQAQALVKGALNGKFDPNVYRDYSAAVEKIGDDLAKRVNEIGGQQYLEAKRFVSDLKDAGVALEKGEARNQAQYQKFVAGGKSVHDVVDFMISKGLRFAPATAQDEAAYRAFHAALVAYDVALNAQGTAADAKAPAGNSPNK